MQFSQAFCKENLIFTTGMPYIALLPPENEFLPKFSTINAHNNEAMRKMRNKKNEAMRKFFMQSLGRFLWSFLHQYHQTL